MRISIKLRKGRLRWRLATGLALGIVVALPGIALAADSSVDAFCSAHASENGSSVNSQGGPASFEGTTFSSGGDNRALADASQQTLKGYSTVHWPGGSGGENCETESSFNNRVLIGPGTSGLNPGDTIVLDVRIRFDALAQASATGAPGAADHLSRGRLGVIYNINDPATVICDPNNPEGGCTSGNIAQFGASSEVVTGNCSQAGCTGFSEAEWSWGATTNTGDAPSDSYHCGADDPTTCTSASISVDRVVHVQAKIGSDLSLHGGLDTYAEAYTSDSQGLADAYRTFIASLAPSSGYEGITLTYETGGAAGPADAAVDEVKVHGRVRAKNKGHNDADVEVCNVGTVPIAVDPGDVTLDITVNGVPTAGQITLKDPKEAVPLESGHCRKWHFRWDYAAGELDKGETVEFTGEVSGVDPADGNGANNSKTAITTVEK